MCEANIRRRCELIVEEEIDFQDKIIVNRYSQFGFYSHSGVRYVLDFQSHFAGKVGKDGSIEWSVGPVEVKESKKHIIEPGFQKGQVSFDEARFNWNYDLRLSYDNNLYLLDSKNYAIRKIDPVNRVVQTICGDGNGGYTDDGELAINARLGSNRNEYFDGPWSLAIDYENNLYIGDTQNNVIRRIDSKTGIIHTVLKHGKEKPLEKICSLDYLEGKLLIPDWREDAPRTLVIARVNDVMILAAKVLDDGSEYDHLFLMVTVDTDKYLVDVGFGDNFFEPLVFSCDLVQQDAKGIFIIKEDNGRYYLKHKNENGDINTAYSFCLDERIIEDFRDRMNWFCQSEESIFKKRLFCSIEKEIGRVSMKPGKLIQTIDCERVEREITSFERFLEILENEFNLNFSAQKGKLYRIYEEQS